MHSDLGLADAVRSEKSEYGFSILHREQIFINLGCRPDDIARGDLFSEDGGGSALPNKSKELWP
jgi:hypothetical protein